MSDNRKEHVDYIGTPFCYEKACLYALEESEQYYNDVQGLDGLTIGLSKDTGYESSFYTFIQDNNINVEIKYIEDVDFVTATENSEIDAFLAGSFLKLEDTKILKDFIQTQCIWLLQKGIVS